MFVEKSRNLSRAAADCLIKTALAILLSSTIAQAASITIDSPGMQTIFSQPSFDGTPITIRFNPSRRIVAPELLNIKDPADLQALFRLAPDPAPTVDAFFVDQLDVCPETEPTINGSFAGCAQLPGHVFVEESDAAKLSPAPLMGHELGHNLNLHHNLFNDTYLMWPKFPPGRLLTERDVAIILQSPLVQTDSMGRRFIQITPIAIVPAPESPTLLLFGSALGPLLVIYTKGRRRSARDHEALTNLFPALLCVPINGDTGRRAGEYLRLIARASNWAMRSSRQRPHFYYDSAPSSCS